jgi:hypothetical protein
MKVWLSDAEAREFTNLPKHRCSDAKISLLNRSASSLVNNYLSGVTTTDDDVPLIQVACMELILYLNRDKSLSSQSFEDASEKLNKDAIKVILAKLDTILLKQTDERDDVKTVRARLL